MPWSVLVVLQLSVLAPSVLIWRQHEAELCSIACSSRLEVRLRPARSLAECIHAAAPQPFTLTASWFMFEIIDFKCHAH
jgi:hypothetical protein